MSKKKPDLYDLFNDESLWGTQETESLSHDDIMNRNWNMITANREQANNPVRIQKQREAQKKNWARPEMREWANEYYGSAEYKEYITARNRELAKDAGWLKNIANANRKKAKDPEWLEANAKAQANRSENNEEWIRKNCRPVSTPYGVFMRVKEAAEAYCAEHPNERYESVNLKLRRWYKSNKKPDWYYLTWEEYDQLKS